MAPVLLLDTLKISTVEFECQQTDAIGGKGQAVLLSWDYGRDITVNLQDALFSMKSLACLEMQQVVDFAGNQVWQAIQFQGPRVPYSFQAPNGQQYSIPNNPNRARLYNENSELIPFVSLYDLSLDANKQYILIFSLTKRQCNGVAIHATDFPNVYYMQGETIARNFETGKDEFCTFIIPKMKILPSFNIELSGSDPSVFNFQGKVLSTVNHQMMKLVKYSMNEIQGDSLFEANSKKLYEALDRRLLAKFGQRLY